MLRTMLARSGLYYLNHSPIERGKVRIGKALHRLTRGVPLKSPLGPVMSARLGDTTFWLYMDRYQAFIADVVNGLEEGDVFIDIGANAGMFSLVAAQRVGTSGRVFAFEPSHREFHELVQNLQLNNANNVIPFRLALDDSNACSELYIADELQSGYNCRRPRKGGS